MRLRRSGIAAREIDGEMVVLDLTSSSYLTTNRTGAVLLELLADDCSADDLADVLVERYGISRARARADVDAFVGTLATKGLLEPPHPEPAPPHRALSSRAPSGHERPATTPGDLTGGSGAVTAH